MKSLCFTLDGLLDAARCADFIGQAEADGYLKMKGDYPPSYRDNDRIVIDSPELAGELFTQLQERLPQSWQALGTGWELVGLNSRFRGCRYRDGQKFTRHRDGAHSEGDQRSFLTVMLYLNDGAEFEGGATRFYRDRYQPFPEFSVAPKAGTGIIFEHCYWHDGEAVREGTKYVLRTDVMYRPTTPSSCQGHAGYVWDIIELADGRLASGSRDRTIRIWDREGRVEQVLTHHTGSVTRLLSRGGGFWSGGRDRRIAVWEPGEEGFELANTFQAHEGAILAMASLFDGRVATCGADNTLRLWSSGGEKLWECETGSWPWCLLQAADGRLLVGCDEGAIAILHPGADRLEPLHQVTTGVLCLLETDHCLLGGCADGEIRRWQRFGRELTSWKGHRGPVTSLTLGPEGQVVSGSEDDGVRLWHEGESKELLRHQDFVRALCLTRDGRLVSGSYDGSVRQFWLGESDSSLMAASGRRYR